jgi:hypothetical protein
MKTKCANGNTVDHWYDRKTRSSVTQVNDAGWDISTTNRAQKIANQELAQERGEESDAATETANRGRAV